MATKSILLAVADPKALADITQAMGDAWATTSASSEAEALAQLEQRSFDALLVDFNLGDPDASELLIQALEKHPQTIRFLLAYEADLALVAAKVSGPHEILPKPVEPASLKSRIESAVAPQDSASDQTGSDPGASTSPAPAVPAVYAEVLKALEAPDVTARVVGEIIAGDAALTAEVLKLTNSSYLGLPRDITDPVEAVESMGLETVKALVMALRFLAEHSQLKPGYLSLEHVWQHSTNVAQLARDLVLFETKDRALAMEALVAGLLHDLGKVVLAVNFDDLYGRVHSLARKQPVALWDVEKEMFGASHGEIGGCLVGMWNIPGSVVEAAAFHHDPPLGEHDHLTPLAAVHIANILEHEIRPSEEFRVAPVISTPFLNEIGLLERLPFWRAVFVNPPAARKRQARPRRRGRAVSANHPVASAEPEVEQAEATQPQSMPPVPSSAPPPNTANLIPTPATATQTGTSGPAETELGMPMMPSFRRRRWLYAGAAAAALGFLVLWIATPDQPVRALAPLPTPSRSPVAVSAAPAPEPAAAAVADATPTATASEEAPPASLSQPEPAAPARAAASEVTPASSLPEPPPAPATVLQATAAKNPTPALAPQEQVLPGFRLNGIIYSVRRPSAIVNGRMVFVGEQVSGATVVSIDRTQVTLQINGQRKVLVSR